jgi:hypothetical protein
VEPAQPSYLGLFGQSESVFDVHAEVANRALDLGVAQQPSDIMRIGTASKLGVPGRIELSNEAKVWNPAIHRVGPDRGDWSHPQL